MKKINLILLILTTFTSFLASKNNDLNLTNAEESSIARISVSEGQWSLGQPEPEFYVGEPVENVSEMRDSTEAGYYNLRHSRVCIADGYEIFTESFFEGCDLEGELSTYYNNLENLYLTESRVNIFKAADTNYELGVTFENRLFSFLRNISRYSDKTFKIPAIVINNTLIASFDVTPNKVDLLIDKSFLSNKNVNQFYQADFNDINGTLANFRAVFQIDLLAKSFLDIDTITTLHYSNVQPTFLSDEDGYEIDSELGIIIDYNSDFILYTGSNIGSSPMDVTYFDYNAGEVVLGHSITYRKYGYESQDYYLQSFGLKLFLDLNGDGSYSHELVQFTRMTNDEYNNVYTNDNLSEEEKRESLENKFIYAPRSKRDDETGKFGTGGLVYSYHIPYLKYSLDKNSTISFYDLNIVEANYWGQSDAGRYAINYQCFDSIKYEYYIEEVLAKGSFEMIGVNLSDKNVADFKYHWGWYILTGGLLGAGELIGEAIVNNGLNIQRLYFNTRNGDNQRIKTVNKIQFVYQKGYQMVNKTVNEDGTINAYYYKEGDLDYMTVGKTPESDGTIYYPIEDFIIPGVGFIAYIDGFFSCEEEPHIVAGRSYDYYYQNVYVTKDRDGMKAYENFMNYWSILSFWYVTQSGTVERCVTNKNGYYLDEYDGVPKIYDIETGEEVDISVDDFLKQEVDGVVYDYEDGELNDTDQFWEDLENNITNFFNGVGDFFKQAGEIFLLILGIVLGLGLVGGTSYLVIKIIDYAKVNKLVKGAANSVQKTNKTKKRRKRRKK